MKKQVLLALMLVPSGLYCMSKTDKKLKSDNNAMICKLNLVLSAGRYVYSEHKEIHEDACRRMCTLIAALDKKEFSTLSKLLENYRQMIESVKERYKKTAPQFDMLVDTFLEESQKNCLKWIFALSRIDTVKPESLDDLACAFERKREKSRDLIAIAVSRQLSFDRGNDISCDAPTITSAVTAWCCQLPDPDFIQRQKAKSFSQELQNLPPIWELKRKLSSFTESPQ